MIISCIQTGPTKGHTQANKDAVEERVLAADADLVVLPELFASGYFFDSTEQAAALAESVPDGPTTHRLHSWARATGATIVAGLPERDGDALYNSAVVVTPNGWLGTYRKTHLFYEETLHFEPGADGFKVWTVTDRNRRSYRLGVMICFDWFFPESARTLALNGADVIAHPSNLVLPHCPTAMPIRALENGVFTATANRVGTESNGAESLTFIGRSVICSPSADVLASAPEAEEAVIRAEIDPHAARETALNPYNDRHRDRRPQLYVR
ncbi:nitrilase-related carbon-nitrogen hydrolase [Rubrivirga marina]|uniref:Acyltransferase n=1 Tax=Rubrivirga marina TaxID=1196024 RepID=A0A271J2X9_9BACT|nr:nitrilase-related carbon-nitrogen hydrolase [Rubrivirga marina]PAP77325.1 acyltransferase [Rubrivirga marina]